MSDTVAAIRAAREVQADLYAPELYRQSLDWFQKAKREYRYKNFSLASEYGKKARTLAEDAEFTSIRSGGMRSDLKPESHDSELFDAPPPPPPEPKPSPYAYPKPEGIPADVYDQRKLEEVQKQRPAPTPSASPAPPTIYPPGANVPQQP